MIQLNKLQLDRLSEFLSNVGLVFFATIITPLFAEGVVNWLIIPIGSFLTMGFLITSLAILKK